MSVTRVLTVDPHAPEPAMIADAAQVLRAGGLVAFPTETVYGLGALALDPKAVARVFVAKGRPATDPLIVHVATVEHLAQVLDAEPPALRTLAARFWPGPLTVIGPRQARVPEAVTAGGPSVAVRVPAHPVAQALLHATGAPIAAPSANRFSHPSPTSADHVRADLDGRIDLIVDGGPTPVGVESTIVDLSQVPPMVLRPGGVTVEALRAVLGEVSVRARHLAETETATAPGEFLRHYAPRTPLTVIDGPPAQAEAVLHRALNTARARDQKVGLLLIGAPITTVTAQAVVTLPAGDDLAPAARRLFAALRDLDAAGCDHLYALLPPPAGLGLAIRDRLIRAAEGRILI